MCQALQCPQRDDKYKGHILRALIKKYHLAPKGVHDVQSVSLHLRYMGVVFHVSATYVIILNVMKVRTIDREIHSK
jgi:hypothetical protein